ncbi:Ldh family oxidoreductase [Pyrococcus abyssi]|uniref:Malate dehydrogenase n=1 Tax=Pyrococcus abyssi (strain GE5 / Orsay) TaxID=272844 RepID=MDH_PYRAB|nr:Ldh family oxidoreductase [Pyrococcus abyssi]Q9V0D5.1 RecName: Full=Malate dehydrogenase [Pyrococcus abyssi GE5]CAB49769.1 mdh malate dehydrogenase [Pyrococcus abyssi GE5]CCE70260.1 TPA: malate dehydrogenase [Pyrococcus abyssi GE5]
MFEKGYVDENYVRIPKDELFSFVVRVLTKLGTPEEDAKIVADNLIMADLRGIESHGVQRLKRYVDGILSGGINLHPRIKIIREGPSYALLDGDEGFGQVVGYKAMKLAIEKARKTGIGIVAVRNSNHYGIAGYYALMAAEEGMIGISMTNSRPLVAPTGGVERILGTNPIALAAPTKGKPFLLDMATSVVPIGKLEVYRRKGEEIPEGWAINSKGEITRSVEEVFNGGSLLPLGGFGELLGGHKGYGLSLMVDILSGILSGGTWSKHVKNTNEKNSNVCHFFMAINIEHFTPLEEFKGRMSEMINEIKNSRKHPDFERIWIHGEKGFLTMETRLKLGIPIYKKVLDELNEIARRVGVKGLEV